MLPLPTNARSFFVAMLRWEGASEEEIEEEIEYLSKNEEGGDYLMLQGGSAGVAQLVNSNDSSVTIAFGECNDILQIYDIARDVYNFCQVERSLLC